MLTPEQRNARTTVKPAAPAYRISQEMAALRGEHAKQITILKARHHNEEIDVLERQQAEAEALARKEMAEAEQPPQNESGK